MSYCLCYYYFWNTIKDACSFTALKRSFNPKHLFWDKDHFNAVWRHNMQRNQLFWAFLSKNNNKLNSIQFSTDNVLSLILAKEYASEVTTISLCWILAGILHFVLIHYGNSSSLRGTKFVNVTSVSSWVAFFFSLSARIHLDTARNLVYKFSSMGYMS